MRTLSSAEVRRELEEIELAAQSGDYELAQYLERGLWRFVLRAIADGAPNAQDLAAEVLREQHLLAQLRRVG